jgi:hypothetical protein
MQMHPFYLAMDPYLIWFYRITGHAFPDFLIGTFVLAWIALIIGEFTISLAFLAGRKRINKSNDDMLRFQNLSVNALKAGNKEAYLASNKLANDAFGNSFFMQIALSAAFLWPIFFSLAWMQYRFSDVEFEVLFLDRSVGHVCIFITLYAAAYLIFRKIKHRLPYFRRINKILDSYQGNNGEIKSLDELLPGERKIGKEFQG